MAVDAAPAPRILILRRDNIGDLACTTPLIAALRAQLPGSWLGALVTTYNAAVLARNPALDEVFVYEKLKHRSGGLLRHLQARLSQTAQLRARRLGCVLVPASSPQSLKLAHSLKPAQVVSAAPAGGEDKHEVERSYEVGRKIGLRGKPGPLRVYPDPQRQAALRARLGEGPLVAVHISARRPAQRWPLERYAALIANLSSRQRVMLLWAPGARGDPRHPGDDEEAAELRGSLEPGGAVPVPTPDLETLIAALSLADRVVCPDGGAMHLAAALGKPVVALFGDSPVERWRPWGVPHRVLRPDSHNLVDLPVKTVLEACDSL